MNSLIFCLTARGRNIALYVSNHEEQFDRLSGMTFAVVFYTGNKNVFVNGVNQH